MTDKALAIFEKMNEMKYTNDLEFSNLMGLFMKVGEPEKVPLLVEEMKRRNIPLSLISYQTWMHSYSCLNDLEGVERVMDKAQRQENIKDEWKLYCNFASAYVKAGQHQKAVPSLKKVEEILGDSNYPDRIGYHHLISLYAGVGDLESVIRAWDKMKSKFPACNNLSYLTMLHILSKLDNVELLKKYFQDWNTKYKSFDLRLPTIVIVAYLRHDMLEQAELLLKDVTDRSGNKVWKVHALFMDYFLGKRQIDSALRHLEKAMTNQWKPLAGSFDPFIEYLIEQKDVNNAEQFFHLIKKDQSLLSTAYLGLLQIYAAAGKIAPEMRERMEQDGANIGTEHEELLEKNSNLMEASKRGASSRVAKKRRYQIVKSGFSIEVPARNCFRPVLCNRCLESIYQWMEEDGATIGRNTRRCFERRSITASAL
uniref:Pentatricopeptide repeat-containing protein n=1 Tax=Chenopodium quinoa TaxID=63459 RepID=A0A803LF27_CHEQI